MGEPFVRLVEWSPAWDKRHEDPTKNYGIHGMELRFVLKGPETATQFVLYTNWLLKHNQEAQDRVLAPSPHLLCHPLPADLGYHSLRPVYSEHQLADETCPYLDGRPCYYDGSALRALDLYWRFVAEGDVIVWRELESEYWDVVHRAAILPLTVGPTGAAFEEPTS